MQTANGAQYFGVGLDLTSLRQGAAEARNLLHGIGQQAASEGSQMDAVFNRMRNTVAGVFAAEKLKDFVTQCITVRGEIQSMETSFGVLLGSQQKGAALFSEIRQFAVSTPMMMKDLAAGAQQMLSFGIATERVMPMLHALGDVSMGDSAKFQSLTLAFAQMSATGKLMGQDLLQMINAGFNPLEQISKTTGKSIGELKDEMSKGAISAQMVEQAFIDATSEGGKFYQMLLKMSGGIEGQISNLQGAIEDMMAGIGEELTGVTTAGITAVTYVVQHYQPLLTILEVLIATYGTYRAALMLNGAMESVVASQRATTMKAIEAEIAAIGVRTNQEVIAADADVAAAVAKGTLTEAEALHIISLKGEAAARVQALQAAAAQAAADLAAAKSAEASALAALKAAEMREAAAIRQLAIAEAQGEVFVIASAKAEVNTATNLRNAAAREYQAAATATDTAAKTANSTATQANSAANALNTLSMQGQQKQMGLLGASGAMLAKSFNSLFNIIRAHPYAALAAAIVGLLSLIYKLSQRTIKSYTEQDALASATKTASDAINEEKEQIKALSDIVHDNNASLKERQKALSDLKSYVKDYHADLTAEGKLINDNTDAINKHIESILKLAKIEALKSSLTTTFTSLSEYANKVRDESVNAAQSFDYLTPGYAAKVTSRMNKWLADFLANPEKYYKLNSDGVASVLIDNSYFNLGMGDDYLSEEKRKLIELAEQYVTLTKVYKDALSANYTEPEKSDVQNKDYWQKQVDDAKKELEALSDVEAAGEKGNKIRKKIAKYRAKLDSFTVDNTSNGNTSNPAKDNADTLAKAAADRMRANEEYTRKLADSAKDEEFAIEQARIDAMDDGLKKTLAQNDLNREKYKEEYIRGQRSMLDDLAEQRMRDAEQANPNLFMEKDGNGKFVEKPGARDEWLRNVRASLKSEDLPGYDQMDKEYKTRLAAYAHADEIAIQQATEQIQTYLQKREKILKDYKNREEDLYTTDESGAKVLRNDVTQGNIDELHRQRDEAVAGVDSEFAAKQGDFESWCNQIGNWTLDKLKEVLTQAETELAAMEKANPSDPKLATLRAQTKALSKEIDKQQKEDKANPGKRTKKNWDELRETLTSVVDVFDKMGEVVGGTAGEIIKSCGGIANITLSMVSKIVDVVTSSSIAMQSASAAGVASIKTMESASVILAIISAALQIATQIASMFDSDKARQEEIKALQERISQLQWELDNVAVLRIQNASEGKNYFDMLKESMRETYILTAMNAKAMGDSQTLYYLMEKNSRKVADWHNRAVDSMTQKLTSLSYTIDKALGEEKYREAREAMNNYASQMVSMMDELETEKSRGKKKDKDRIAELERNINEKGQEAREVLTGLFEDLVGGSAESIANDLADAFFDAFAAGEDAAQAWGNKVHDIVGSVLKRMLVTKLLEQPIGKLMDKYMALWMPGGEMDLNAVQQSLPQMMNQLNGTFTAFDQFVSLLPQQYKQMLKDSMSSREAATQGIATASQESVDELNGRMTAVQSHTYSIAEQTKRLVENSTAILLSVMNIETNTTDISTSMVDMRTDLRDVRATLSDIQRTGLRLTK